MAYVEVLCQVPYPALADFCDDVLNGLHVVLCCLSTMTVSSLGKWDGTGFEVLFHLGPRFRWARTILRKTMVATATLGVGAALNMVARLSLRSALSGLGVSTS